MLLVEALERKKALDDLISKNMGEIVNFLGDQKKLSEILTNIDSLIDQFYNLERFIQKSYESTMLSTTESISDIISYTDGITKKIDVLKLLILEINKKEITTSSTIEIDLIPILSSIRQYEELRQVLVKKVRDLCYP